MPERTAPRFTRAWATPPRPGAASRRAGGLSVLERQLFTAARAGLRSLRIDAPEPPLPPHRPSGLEILWQDAGPCEPPYLVLSSDHLLRVDALAAIASGDYPETVSFEDDRGALVARAVVAADDGVTRVRQTLDADACRRVADIGPAELTSWLMRAAPKSGDGFMARHFDRHLSTAVSRLLLDTPVTPNAMTALSTGLGLVGASLFLGSSRAACVGGALVVWLHSVLDGCDGELARVRFQESALGSDLDFWGDNLVHLALFACLGLGLWRAGGGIHTLALAAVADFGVAASAWTAWCFRLSRRASAAAPDADVRVTDEAPDGLELHLSRLENTLAQRDFLYLLVLLAAADRIYEFLWAAAIGGLLYFGIMLYLRRVNEHEYARRPHTAC